MASLPHLHLLLLPLLVLLASFVTPGCAVDCFLCSHSPRHNTSREDACTDFVFSSDRAGLLACELGCEAVATFDSNGELENFHRNCATGSTIMTNTCETYNMRIISRRVCSCDTSYCNTAVGTTTSRSRGAPLLTLCLALGLGYILAT
ncbi:hypothetical protein Pcinc_038935 [Petrolisthes cinctipes]|uniref:Protein quiver n=1 Tax=Petrolisthes cinctipes TaxID=88211 RepID=A0AAE1BQF3_PETCI|nr:hypothetical protein Pcinc_038935 [Petrolisthes cinctipes]